jgi:hypothetical protein
MMDFFPSSNSSVVAFACARSEEFGFSSEIFEAAELVLLKLLFSSFEVVVDICSCFFDQNQKTCSQHGFGFCSEGRVKNRPHNGVSCCGFISLVLGLLSSSPGRMKYL